MPLKTTGEISFSEIAGEFFKSPPYRLSEFYRGSLVVPDTELNIGVPTSGTVAFSDFYGTAFAIPPTIPAGAIVFYTGATAPSGWQEYTAAYGRYVKGTTNTSQIGTTSAVAIPNGIPQSTVTGTSGAHTGSTFTASGMGATSGSVRGYPINSSTPGNHNHVVSGIPRATAEAIAPEPPHAVFKMIKTLTDTQVLPAGSIIIAQNRPSPAWNNETRTSGSNNIYVKASGMNPGEIDRLTGLPSAMSATTSTAGSHDHRLPDNNRFFNAGTNTTTNLYAVDGNHSHANANVTVSVLKIKSICLNLWRSAQDAIGASNTIFMYDGDLNNLPEDWYVCNGLNGTVDLADRFIQIGGSNGVQHGVKEENSQLQFQWSSILSGPDPSTHNHRQTNTSTFQTFTAAAFHQLFTWSHSHTAPATSSQTGNVYSPPAISLGFIQYIKDNVNLSSITVSQNATAINEGATATITVSHVNYPVGTVIYWDTEAVTGTLETNEFTDNALTGSFTITTLNSSNNVLRTPTNDNREEGLEVFRIRFYSDSARTQLIGASQNITINDTSLPQYLIRVQGTNGVDTVTVNEGDTVVFELLTTVLSAGTTVYWSTSSSTMTAADFTDNTLANSVNLETFGAYRRALVSRQILTDATTEGTESFQLVFRTGSTTGTIRATSNSVTVNDTSLTPTYASTGGSTINLGGTNEGNRIWEHYFTGTNVPSGGETLTYVIVSYDAGTGESTVATASDFIGGLSGTITTAATFTVTVRAAADAVTEPNERFLLELRRGGINGTLITSSGLAMTVLSDTNATYNFTASTTTPNWGDSINFNLQLSSGVHNTNTVFYFKIMNWSTNDFNTQEVTRVLKGTSTTQTTFTVSTKSSLIKAGKSFTVQVWNDDPVAGRGVLLNVSPQVTITAAGFTSLTPAASSVNEGTALAFTLSTSGIPNNTIVYWNIDFNSSSATADFSTTQGSVSIQNNSATISITPTADATTEGAQTFKLRVYTDSGRTNLAITSSTVTINDTSKTPTITSLTPSATSVNEGSSVSFTASGADHSATTTYYYRLVATSGSFNAADITATTLDGTLTYSSTSQSGQAVVSLVNDLTTEGVERFRMDLYSDSARTVLVRSSAEVTVNDTSVAPTYRFGTIPTSINEGASGTFNVITTNVPNNTTLYWSVLHDTIGSTATDNADFTTVTGSFLISSNAGSFNVNIAADQITEGSQSFRVNLRTTSVSGPIQATSGYVTINDTSQTPTYAFGTIPTSINEGVSGTFNVSTTNIPNSTVLYWTISHISTAAADFSANSGSFSITSNAGSFTVTPTADAATEGPQTFRVEIRTTSTTGTIRATSNIVTVNDTSLTQPGQVLFQVTTSTTTRVATWTVPAGVTSVSVVCIGGGGGGRAGSSNGSISSGGGGGGGGLSYRNNIAVTPGSSITVQIGRAGNGIAGAGTGGAGAGGQSYFFTTSTVAANGGGGGQGSGGVWAGGTAGTVVNNTGAVGFSGGVGGGGPRNVRAGGGGAAGYAGAGGRGGGGDPSASATAGAGGGGGGGGFSTAPGPSFWFGGHGGAARATGQPPNGTAGGNSTTSNGGDGQPNSTPFFGGGGAGGNATSVNTARQNGWPGAVRIIWPGNLRSYPSTRVADE